MKRIIAVLLIVLILCLVSCTNNPGEPTLGTIPNNRIRIWTDPETGVQYIIYQEMVGKGGMGGITPRFNADGTLYIEGEQQ